MFAKSLAGVMAIGTACAAVAQTQNSTTNCYTMGTSVQCNTNTTTMPPKPTLDWGAINRQQQVINQQNQQNTTRAFENLGAAIAADREQRRQRKEAAAVQAQADAARALEEADLSAQKAQADSIQNAMQAAIDRDSAPTPPPPAEKPVLLSCAIGNSSSSLALYEKNQRVDVTEAGVTKARAGTFAPDTVSWIGSVWRTAVNRVDMSLISVAILPELSGVQVTGTCSLTERKF